MSQVELSGAVPCSGSKWSFRSSAVFVAAGFKGIGGRTGRRGQQGFPGIKGDQGDRGFPGSKGRNSILLSAFSAFHRN